jgi:PIN domain nuclease of toxin-antitoxin system
MRIRYLLDTCALIWLLQKSDKLSKNAKELIDDIHTEVFASTVSFWEISLKHSIGKLHIKDLDVEDIVEILVDDMHIGIIGLNEQESLSFYRLPFLTEHRDPFDRMLVWQAIKRNMAIISCDPALAQYQQCGLRLIW